MGENLTEHDIMALGFLMRGPDQPGVIDSEEVMCATLFYMQLSNRGLVHMDRAEGGPVFTISAAGQRAYQRATSPVAKDERHGEG